MVGKLRPMRSFYEACWCLQ